MKILCFYYFVFLFFCSTGFSQVFTIEIPWSDPLPIKYNEESIYIPSIQGQSLDNVNPVFYHTVPLKNDRYSAELINYSTSPASAAEVAFLERFSVFVSDDIQLDTKITKAGKEAFLVIFSIPYIKVDKVIHRIQRFDVKITPKEASQSYLKDFAPNSVLQDGSGFWYKIAVSRDGIYKLDKSFLSSIGIDVTTLDPSQLHIYGNGEGMMPELNSIPRIDDLAQVAVYINGEADGVFNDQDYLLFYGSGPHQWFPNGTVEFDQKRNVYSDFSYYFVNVNPNVLPLRIQNAPLITSNPDVVVTDYDYRDVYENDLISLVGGGQRWYGELFDIDLERTFNFSIPNIVTTSPVKFKTALATNSLSTANTAQKYFCNGTQLLNDLLPSAPYDFARSTKAMIFSAPSSLLAFKVSITRNSPNTLTYLDRILVNAKRDLVFYGSQFGFRNLVNSDSLLLGEYQISNFPTQGFIWDVTNKQIPTLIVGSLIGASSTFSFKQNMKFSEFVASNGSLFYEPDKIGTVNYQNLHSLPQADYLIVTNPLFFEQANRLANLHRDEGLIVHVVTDDQVYNEFSSGAKDAVGIRMFVKMFYDRANLVSGSLSPKYLLLFGDGTYDPKDRVPNNNNYMLTYQVDNSENHISALVTDDFFGMLGDNEAINQTDLLDVGVGRLVVSNVTEAKQQVDKIEHYMKNGSNLFLNSSTNNCCLDSLTNGNFGDWRLKYIQISDDEEGGYFINNDTEPQYDIVKSNHREMNCDKLYLDAYPQQTSAGGQRYPEVYSAITDRVERGALVVNYVGHGGEVGLAEERVVTIPQIQSWKNINALHLFVSATCEFTKFDDPNRISAGEWLALNPTGGAIALMTTTRSVYFGVNTATGTAFYNNVFERDANMQPKTFGEIVRLTKNQSGSNDNKRSFTLIGDPALKIALPRLRVVTDSLNGQTLAIIDTIKALGKVTIKGHIEDFYGNVQSNFNGYVLPSIFDKTKNFNTLGQDDTSPVINYELQRNVVYKGKSTVTNGTFAFTFIVPKDIALNYGLGKISYYAFNNSIDAAGVDTTFSIGGIDPIGVLDNVGPSVELFLNDDKFIDGGITDATPVLFAKIFDENGINTVGNGIGHDLTAIIDENTAESINLNDYYSSDLDTYQSGTIRYELPELTEGAHSISLKVWDVNNNSSLTKINFLVRPSENAAINHLYNYPNPFTSNTKFMFEHNQSCDNMDVQIQVYSVSGRLVKTILEKVQTVGFRTEGLNWDGKDDFGDKLARGVYIYRLSIKTDSGETAQKTEKLVIF